MKTLLILVVFLTTTAYSLRCFEGTIAGLTNNTQTSKKECGGISNYCIQRINKKSGEMRRECSSWSDEHSMEEKCPMSGCHFVSKDESFCCCQFDECNEWKGDGTEFKAGETVIQKTIPSAPKQESIDVPSAPARKTIPNKFDRDENSNVVIPTTPEPAQKSSFVDVN